MKNQRPSTPVCFLVGKVDRRRASSVASTSASIAENRTVAPGSHAQVPLLRRRREDRLGGNRRPRGVRRRRPSPGGATRGRARTGRSWWRRRARRSAEVPARHRCRQGRGQPGRGPSARRVRVPRRHPPVPGRRRADRGERDAVSDGGGRRADGDPDRSGRSSRGQRHDVQVRKPAIPPRRSYAPTPATRSRSTCRCAGRRAGPQLQSRWPGWRSAASRIPPRCRSLGFGPWETIDANVIGGAGGRNRMVGDLFYGDLRRPFIQAGMWGLVRVLDRADVKADLKPLG